jgi:hypothetical protein
VPGEVGARVGVEMSTSSGCCCCCCCCCCRLLSYWVDYCCEPMWCRGGRLRPLEWSCASGRLVLQYNAGVQPAWMAVAVFTHSRRGRQCVWVWFASSRYVAQTINLECIRNTRGHRLVFAHAMSTHDGTSRSDDELGVHPPHCWTPTGVAHAMSQCARRHE